MQKSLSQSLRACLFVAATVAQGQNLFLLPGANSTSGSGAVFSGGSLTSSGAFTAGAGVFQVLATPSGNKYYAIANSGSATVTVLDGNFSNARQLGNLGLQATAAAITPNGSRLLVVAGTLHIFDTSTDNDLLPNGLNPGAPLFDIAISLDGTRAYVLGRNSSGIGSTLYAINLANNAVVASYPITGAASGVSVGPNNYVYVGTVNQIIELNPNTLTQTAGGLIPLNASPGKLVFTPDGRFGLAVNQTPITGSSVIVLDLAAHSIVGPPFLVTPDNGSIDRLLVAGNNLVIGFSSQKQSLYQISLAPASISPFSVPGVNVAVTTALLSREIAGGSRTSAQFLYFIGANTLYKVDLTAGNFLVGQVALPTVANVISIAGPANTSGVPATLLQFGNNQILSAGAGSGPIVIRVLDAQGLPVSGVPVTFTSTNTAVGIPNGTVITSPDGFAVSSAVAPTTNGIFTVAAAVPGGLSVNFQFGVGATGGAAGNSASVTIVAGQGQVVNENFNTGTPGFGNPFVVAVKDVTGAAVVGAPVTFSVQGPGNVSSGQQGATNGVTTTVNSDANGLASAAFLSQTINPGSGYQQTIVSASAPGTNTVQFFITTTTQQPNGITAAPRKPVNGDVIMGQSGTTLKGAVLATVGSNVGPVPNVGIRLITLDFNGNPVNDPSQGPFVSCADPNGTGVLSDMTGLITCDLVFGPKVGSGQFQIQLGYTFLSQAFPFVVTTGPPSALRIVQGNNQTALPGQTLPSAFVVQVTDAGGNPLTGVPVNFSVTPAGAVTFTNVNGLSNGSGQASAQAVLGNIGGPVTVRVTAGSASASFNVTVSIPVAGVQPVSGGGQSTLIGTTFASPLQVKITDAGGSPVAGVQVSFVVTSGSASITSPTVTTNASGLASTTVSAGTNVGPITVAASANGFSTTFALTSLRPGPTNVAFSNGASFEQGMSPGSIVTITGNGIAPGVQGVVTPGFIVGPLPTSLAGVQVLFNGIPAPLYSVSNVNGKEAVTVQVPFELPPGTATVTLSSTSGGTATLANVPISLYSPGIFETLLNGQKLGVAIRPDGSYVSPSNPAHPGDVTCFFATGLGQVSPAAFTNSTGIAGQNVVAPLDVGVNNGGVRLVSATYLPSAIGVYEVCLQIPLDTATGPSQPIGLIVHDTSGNSFFAQGTSIPIQ